VALDECAFAARSSPGPGFFCDTLIVGTGITGALIAERLTRRGLDVVLIDRQQPGLGSTAASTAMLLWEIDRPLSELTDLYGYERGVRCYHASLQAMRGLESLVTKLRVQCRMRARESLYVAAENDVRDLRTEAKLRQHAGLPSTFLDYPSLLGGYGIAREAALRSGEAADTDPVLLTNGLLKVSMGRGARLYRANAVDFDSTSRGVLAVLEHGIEITARHLVLATGYVMPDIVRSSIQSPASSWAIATVRQPDKLWKGGALIWEARQNYHYARTTDDGRIIFGGEDEEVVDPDRRNALTSIKIKRLTAALHELWPSGLLDLDYSWSGTFDTTADGLPLIGRVPGFTSIFAGYGYGGNGVTFSYMAAYLIDLLIAGKTSPLLDDFAIDRRAP
jgi:glycine/D-amino acid oxidase-like deaminating enzyme